MPPFAISVPLILELTTLFRTILLLLSASLPKDVMIEMEAIALKK